MLYEFAFKFHFFDLLRLLFWILPFCIWGFAETLKSKIIRRVLTMLAGLLLIVLFVFLLVMPVRSYFIIKEKIKIGDVQVVEGEVSNFETPPTNNVGHGSESFEINGVSFDYNEMENYGYSTFLCAGGVITGNGQRLKITYCYDSFQAKNVICYIESEE